MRVGLTGHYASGKSTVSSIFEEFGAIIIDTDDISREIVEPGMTAYKKIVSHFGGGILTDKKYINRKKLGDMVFSNKEKLQLLNSITHPEILKFTLQRSSNPEKIYIINVPLLYQAGYNVYMDKIVIVTADTGLCISRGSNRDSINTEKAARIIKSQNSINEYLNKADYIIDNSGLIEYTQNQVKEIWNSLIINMRKK